VPLSSEFVTVRILQNSTIQTLSSWGTCQIQGAGWGGPSANSVIAFYTLVKGVTGTSNNEIYYKYFTFNTTFNLTMVNTGLGSIEGVPIPQSSLNQTNTTLAGVPTLFSLNWTDTEGLSAWVFSLRNCTNTYVNNSAILFSGGTWSNATNTSNFTSGCTMSWKVFANNTNALWNVSQEFNYTTTGDITPPTFSSYSANTTIAGMPVNFSVIISDGTTLSGYIFETNNTGTWINTTWVSLTSGGTAQNITTLNSTRGVVVNVSFYANDSSNNWGTYKTSLTTNLTYIGICQVLDQAGATYYLTDDIIDSSTSNCINIIENNVTLDCQGHTIDGDNVASYGINVHRTSSNKTNVTIRNCILTNWNNAEIYFYRSNNNIVENVTIASGNKYGLYLFQSNNSLIKNVTAYGFSVPGSGYAVVISSSYNNTVIDANSSNNFMGISIQGAMDNVIENSIIYDNDWFDFYITGDSRGCNNILTNVNGTGNKPIVFFNYTVQLNNWDNNSSMIILCNANNSMINNVTISHSSIKKNNALFLVQTSNTTITNSSFYSLTHGILFDYSGNNTIINITSKHCSQTGMRIATATSSFNTINNSIFENNTVGISIYTGSPANNVFYNNLLNNSNNSLFSSVKNNQTWNTTQQSGTRIYSSGTQIGGNYWTNSTNNGYSDTCGDSTCDGFCDIPYYFVDGTCEGTATPCVDILEETDCEEQLGCGWDVSCYDDELVACSQIYNSIDCGTQNGCNWNTSNPRVNNVDYLPYSDEYVEGGCVGAPSCRVDIGPPQTNEIRFKSTSPIAKGVPPENQTSTFGILNLTNNGTASATGFQLKINNTVTGWTMKCSNTSTYTNSIVVDTTYRTVYIGTVDQDAIVQEWCFIDLFYPTKPWIFEYSCSALS
jgi:hypothetical protein